MKKLEQLNIYEQSIILVKDIYSIKDTFPEQEIDGLLSQIRITASLMLVKIETGFYTDSSDTGIKYITTAYEYATNLYCLIHIYKNLNLITREFDDLLSKLVKIMRIIYDLRKSLLKEYDTKTTCHSFVTKN